MKLQVYGKTDIGLTRKNNEDSYLVDRERQLFIVADGMGGHVAGEVASRIAIETTAESLQSIENDDVQCQLERAVNAANQTVREAADTHTEWRGMGTTLTVTLFHQQTVSLAHVGDSRVYRWKNQQLQQLSDDHSLAAEQLRRGILSRSEAQTSSLGNILLQAVGLSPDLDICLKQFPVTAGELFLLCSDGLTNMLSDNRISEVMQTDRDVQHCAEELINRALAAGGRDNITVIVIKVDEL
jgi:protein phosphatase